MVTKENEIGLHLMTPTLMNQILTTKIIIKIYLLFWFNILNLDTKESAKNTNNRCGLELGCINRVEYCIKKCSKINFAQIKLLKTNQLA